MSNVSARCGILFGCLLLAASFTATAQFRETPPAPYSNSAARQKIRTLIQNVNLTNQGDTIRTLSGLLVWYRDVVDDELIAAWKSDARVNVPELMGPLADAHLASAVIDFSWNQQRSATFTLDYAPMLRDLMARYPASAERFLHDLNAATPPVLSKTEADALCRILFDLPDTKTWKKVALQVLPRYRQSAQELLAQDASGGEQEKAYRAQIWADQLKLGMPGDTSDAPEPHRRLAIPPGSPPPPAPPVWIAAGRPHIVGEPNGATDLSAPAAAPGGSDPPGPFPFRWTGPRSGTLKCEGPPTPPDGEYSFSGMPPGNIQLDLDSKVWGAQLAPGKGTMQNLILTNKTSKAQKHCTVDWKLLP